MSQSDSEREEAIRDLSELAEEAIAYVDQYFVDKWQMVERLRASRAALSLSPEGGSELIPPAPGPPPRTGL